MCIGFQQTSETATVHHIMPLNSLDILGEGYDTKVKQWRAELMPKVVQTNNVRVVPSIHNTNVIFRQHKFASIKIPGEAVSTMFREQEEETEEEEHPCDLTLDTTLKTSRDWDHDHLTCTPTKLETSNLESGAFSPVSFLGPDYSFLSAEDSVNELSVYKATGIQSSMIPYSTYPSHDVNFSQMNHNNAPPNKQLTLPVCHITPLVLNMKLNQVCPNQEGSKVVGDNDDKHIKARYMHVDQQVQSLHYFHAYATRGK